MKKEKIKLQALTTFIGAIILFGISSLQLKVFFYNYPTPSLKFFIIPILLGCIAGFILGAWLYNSRKSRQQLEKTIEKRTHSLEEVNQQLEKELIERKEIESTLRTAKTQTETAHQQLEKELIERKGIEETLRIAKAQAEKANNTKSEFLANMSHEIRTPLNAIIGFAQILLNHSAKEEISQKNRRYLQRIMQSGSHLLELINNILDLSRIEAGKLSLSEEDLNLKQLFQGVYHMYHSEALKKGLKLSYNFDPKLPEFIYSDRTKLNQILINLVANAIKFTTQGQIDLFAEQKDDSILFKIVDEGIGISADRQDAIFKAFEQEDNSTTRRFGGSGLGLAITQKVVTLLKGHIWLESQLGKGTIFYVELPLKKGKQISYQSDQQLLALQRFSKENTILVIEDNALNQEMMTALFEELDLSIHLAQNGKEGVKKLLELQMNNQTPDLVLMDIHMPVMDGMEAIKKIRKNESMQEIPIIALSADAFAKQQKEAIHFGFTSYLTKPLNFKKIYPLLQKYLRPEKQAQITLPLHIKRERTLLDEEVLNQFPLSLRQRMVTLFCHQASESIKRLEACIEAEDFQNVVQVSHFIRGSALGMGASKMAALSQTIQEEGKAKDSRALPAYLDELKSVYEETIQNLLQSQ